MATFGFTGKTLRLRRPAYRRSPTTHCLVFMVVSVHVAVSAHHWISDASCSQSTPHADRLAMVRASVAAAVTTCSQFPRWMTRRRVLGSLVSALARTRTRHLVLTCAIPSSNHPHTEVLRFGSGDAVRASSPQWYWVTQQQVLSYSCLLRCPTKRWQWPPLPEACYKTHFAGR